MPCRMASLAHSRSNCQRSKSNPPGASHSPPHARPQSSTISHSGGSGSVKPPGPRHMPSIPLRRKIPAHRLPDRGQPFAHRPGLRERGDPLDHQPLRRQPHPDQIPLSHAQGAQGARRQQQRPERVDHLGWDAPLVERLRVERQRDLRRVPSVNRWYSSCSHSAVIGVQVRCHREDVVSPTRRRRAGV